MIEIFTLPGVTDPMIHPEFWYEGPGENDILLTQEEIREINLRTVFEPGTRMTKFSELSTAFRVSELRQSLHLPESDGSHPLSCSPDGENAELRFGICIRRTEMTRTPYSDESRNHAEEALSAVHVNDGLAVFLRSADAKWLYVRSRICSGWVPAEDVVLMEDREEFRQAMTFENFLVVTGSDIALEADPENPALSGRTFEMGTRLELAEGDIHLVSGRLSCYNYIVLIPTRGEDGCLRKEKALIPVSADVSVGYLPLTRRNLVTQAFKSLGRRYSWGGADEGQDCSSYIREVYSCFGFRLPRNTSWQSRMPVCRIELEGLTPEEKSERLRKMPVGAILFFPGHEILYLGERDGDFFVINNLGPSVLTRGASVIRVYGVSVNSLTETARANGMNWLEAITHAVIPFLPDSVDGEERL